MDLSIIYNFGIEELWELFRGEISKALNDEDNLRILNAVKLGEEIKFDIRDFISNRYSQETVTIRAGKNGKFKRHETRILINKNKIELKSFEDEIDLRKDLMRGWLSENWQDTSLGKTRTEEVKE